MITTKLKKVRMARGLTQSYVAAKAGISITQYQRLERGECNIRRSKLKNVLKMAEILNVNPMDLLD